MASIATPPTNTKEQMTIRATSAADILDECWGRIPCVVIDLDCWPGKGHFDTVETGIFCELKYMYNFVKQFRGTL